MPKAEPGTVPPGGAARAHTLEVAGASETIPAGTAWPSAAATAIELLRAPLLDHERVTLDAYPAPEAGARPQRQRSLRIDVAAEADPLGGTDHYLTVVASQTPCGRNGADNDIGPVRTVEALGPAIAWHLHDLDRDRDPQTNSRTEAKEQAP